MIALLLPALAAAATAEPPGHWTWLPQDSLYALPIADSRSPQSQVTLRKDYANGAGELLPFGKIIDATVAGQIAFGELALGDGARAWHLQPGISAGVFLGFRSDAELTFDLLTFDGVFGFPIDVRWGIWAARLQWAHVSAHTADGVRKIQPDPPVPEGSWSQEYWQLQGGPELDWWRVYGGVLMVTHAIQDAGRWTLQIGGSVEGPWAVAPYAAVDLKLAQSFSWRPTTAGQIGVSAAGGDQRVRLGLTGSAGLEDTGKFDGREERYIGLIFGLDTIGRL